MDQIAIARFQPRLEEPEFAFDALDNLMFVVDLPSIKGALLLLRSPFLSSLAIWAHLFSRT